jgi:hypothetical protein
MAKFLFCTSKKKALYNSGRTICFGDGTNGAIGTNSEDFVAGPSSGPLLSLQPLISFSDNAMPIVQVVAGSAMTCVLRCDDRVLCFGVNGEGQLGRGDVASYGRSGGQMPALNPIGFDTTVIPVFSPSLTSLVLTSGLSLPNVSSQTLHNVIVTGATEIGVSTFAAQALCGSPVVTTLNGEPVTKPITVNLYVTNFLYVIVTAGGSTTTYTIAARRFPEAKVQAGIGHTCFLVSNRVTCWGVEIHNSYKKKISTMRKMIIFYMFLYSFLHI